MIGFVQQFWIELVQAPFLVDVSKVSASPLALQCSLAVDDFFGCDVGYDVSRRLGYSIGPSAISYSLFVRIVVKVCANTRSIDYSNGYVAVR